LCNAWTAHMFHIMSVELTHIAQGESGPPVVILHGLLGSARNWSTVARQLGATHRVFALDLRNHGGSSWADSMTYDEMAEDVRAFMARHALPAAAVIGHSMGGKVAMRLALTHGDEVERLIVVDVAPVDYRRSFAAYIDVLRRLDLSRLTRRSDAAAWLADHVDDEGVRGFLLQNLVSVEGGFAWRVNLHALADGMPELMGFPEGPSPEQYGGPALFLTGGRSDYVREEHRPTILRLFPNAEIVTIPDAGHWVHAEASEKFLKVVRDFLA
jgi:esterase